MEEEIDTRSPEEKLSEAEFNHGALLQTVSNPAGIAEYITFTNSHDVAYHLFHTNPEAAQALMNELMYWVVGKSDG